MGVIAAIGTGVTALAASAGIAVTATALTVGFETVAAVGAVLSVVGTVTKNKTLSMVGAGLGLVGGIGAFASAAGVLGSGGGLFADAASTPAAANIASAGTIDSLSGASGALDPLTGAADAIPAGSPLGEGLTAGTSAGAIPGGVDASLDIAQAPLGGNLQTLNTDAANTGDPAAAQALKGASDGTSTTSGLTNLNLPGATDTPQPVAASGTSTANLAGTGTQTAAPPVTAPVPGQAPVTGQVTGNVDTNALMADGTTAAKTPGMLQGVLDFANKNPAVTFGAVQAGGSFLSGLTSSVTPAQAAQLNSQAAQNQAAADLINQQRNNLSQPKAVASLTPVTGTPQPIIPQQPQITFPGIINNAQRLAPVTGTPA